MHLFTEFVACVSSFIFSLSPSNVLIVHADEATTKCFSEKIEEWNDGAMNCQSNGKSVDFVRNRYVDDEDDNDSEMKYTVMRKKQ